MSLKFGTSGVRGLVSDLTDSEVYLFTKSFLMHARSLGQESAVALAHDLRESSPRIQDAVIQAIQDDGRQAILCGEIPTPALAYYAKKRPCLAVMITGSHIPADRNGIKFYLETGETLKGDDQAIFSNYQSLKNDFAAIRSTKTSQAMSTETKARSLYIQRYLDFFPAKILFGMRLIFYQHSSIARDIFPEILEQLGAEVVRIGFSKTFIPVDTEAVESVDKFKDWILSHKADALISTDGDADRPLFIDAQGSVIPGDKLGALTSMYLGCEAIALPISCNSGIAKMANFKEVTLTKIGSPFVVQALNDLGQKFEAIGGFEANGGYLLKSDITLDEHSIEALPTRDAVIPVLSLLALAKTRSLKNP